MFFFLNSKSCSLFFLFNPHNFLNCKVTALIFSVAFISDFSTQSSLFFHKCVSWHAFYSCFSVSSDLLIPASRWLPSLTSPSRTRVFSESHSETLQSGNKFRMVGGCSCEVQYRWQANNFLDQLGLFLALVMSQAAFGKAGQYRLGREIFVCSNFGF